MKASKASAFLENMNLVPEATPDVQPGAGEAAGTPGGKRPGTRQGLKHIGGYFDREMVEKVAVLRARLGLDNSALLTVAINDLYSKQQAKRAFNDQ